MEQPFLSVDHPMDHSLHNNGPHSGHGPHSMPHPSGNNGDSGINPSYSPKSDGSLVKATKLETPIPPLHVQQKYLDDSNKIVNVESTQFLRSNCSRCKKDFDQPIVVPKSGHNESAKPLAEPKIFKLCQHCRELQRQRLRRWQKKTKEKFGVCRRCGNDIPPELQKFVLCLNCRQNLRFRKANRAKQGRCVHCSGPLDTSILNNGNGDGNTDDGTPKQHKNFKVCQRCRENDKIRRNNLEKLGNCNRCAKPLSNDDIGKHKVCINCRSKKKKSSSVSNHSPDELLQHQMHSTGILPIPNYGLDANTVANGGNGITTTVMPSSGVMANPANVVNATTNGNANPNANGNNTGDNTTNGSNQGTVVNNNTAVTVPVQNNPMNPQDFDLHYQSYPIQQQLNQALQPSNPVPQQQVSQPQPPLNQSQLNQNPSATQPMTSTHQVTAVASSQQQVPPSIHQPPTIQQNGGPIQYQGYYNNQLPMNMNQLPLHQFPIQHPIMVNQLGQYNQLPQLNNQLYQPMNNYHPVPINQLPPGQLPNQPTNPVARTGSSRQSVSGASGQKISPLQQNLQMGQIPYHYQ